MPEESSATQPNATNADLNENQYTELTPMERAKRAISIFLQCKDYRPDYFDPQTKTLLTALIHDAMLAHSNAELERARRLERELATAQAQLKAARSELHTIADMNLTEREYALKPYRTFQVGTASSPITPTIQTGYIQEFALDFDKNHVAIVVNNPITGERWRTDLYKETPVSETLQPRVGGESIAP